MRPRPPSPSPPAPAHLPLPVGGSHHHHVPGGTRRRVCGLFWAEPPERRDQQRHRGPHEGAQEEQLRPAPAAGGVIGPGGRGCGQRIKAFAAQGPAFMLPLIRTFGFPGGSRLRSLAALRVSAGASPGRRPLRFRPEGSGPRGLGGGDPGDACAGGGCGGSALAPGSAEASLQLLLLQLDRFWAGRGSVPGFFNPPAEHGVPVNLPVSRCSAALLLEAGAKGRGGIRTCVRTMFSSALSFTWSLLQQQLQQDGGAVKIVGPDHRPLRCPRANSPSHEGASPRLEAPAKLLAWIKGAS